MDKAKTIITNYHRYVKAGDDSLCLTLAGSVNYYSEIEKVLSKYHRQVLIETSDILLKSVTEKGVHKLKIIEQKKGKRGCVTTLAHGRDAILIITDNTFSEVEILIAQNRIGLTHVLYQLLKSGRLDAEIKALRKVCVEEFIEGY